MNPLTAYLCVIVKDEELDVMEWVLFHLFLGFNKIIVFDNASSDSTREKIISCRNYGDVEYIYWPERGSQNKAYFYCIQNFGATCDWMAFFDIDEFLVLPKHKYIGNFLASIAEQNAVAINWRMFGSSGHHNISNALITQTFTNRANDNFSANRHIKSIVRPSVVKKVINPHFFYLRRIKWHSTKQYEYRSPNGSTLQWIKPGKTVGTGEADIARIHHYFTKSLEHYQRKIARGNADNARARIDFFERNNWNDIFDNTIIEIYSDEIRKIQDILSNRV